jgi:hypothetical protein
VLGSDQVAPRGIELTQVWNHPGLCPNEAVLWALHRGLEAPISNGQRSLPNVTPRRRSIGRACFSLSIALDSDFWVLYRYPLPERNGWPRPSVRIRPAATFS